MNEPPVKSSPHYRTLAALRLAHRDLLRRHRQDGDNPQLMDEIVGFVQEGIASGLLLDDNADRRVAQDLLDFWSNILSHARIDHPDPTLAEFDISLSPELGDELSPYVGLNAFQTGDSHNFFGRQELVDEMVGRLKEGRFLAVLGPSGSGKSSVVMAGLLPALHSGALPGGAGWHFFPRLVPGPEPLANLAALFQPEGDAPSNWIDQQGKRFLSDDQELLRLANNFGSPAILLVDQFEELFTLSANAQVQGAYVANLLAFLRASESRHILVLTMRTDFEDYLVRFQDLRQEFTRSSIRLSALSAPQLRDAIEKPAELVGLKFEEGLVDALVHEIVGEPAGLPLLQFCLLKLWENRVHNRVTPEAFQRIGRGRLALARAADDLYDSLIPEEQRTARRILMRIVRPGEGVEITSNRVRRELLYRAGEARDRIDRVLTRFEKDHLLRCTPGETPMDDRIEVAHEALVRNWPRLGEWLDQERVRLRQRLRLTSAAEHWEALKRDRSALWLGEQLQEAITQKYDDLEILEKAFLDASQAAERVRTGMRIAIPAAFVLLLILLLVAFTINAIGRANEQKNFANQQAADQATARANAERLVVTAQAAQGTAVFERNAAATQESIAQREKENARNAEKLARQAEAETILQANTATSRRLAGEAIRSLESNPPLSLLLAVEASRKSHTSESEDALRQSIQNTQLRAILRAHVGSGASFLAFNQDGTRLLTGGSDKTVKLWDATTGTEIAGPDRPETNQDNMYASATTLAYSPDGAQLALARWDGYIYLMDGMTGVYRRFLYSQNPVRVLAYGPTSDLFASGSGNGAVQLWSSGKIMLLEGHREAISALVFNPDGSLLATASIDGAVRLWSVATGEALVVFQGKTGGESPLAFSPDGRLLAGGFSDGSIRVWMVSARQELGVLSGHTSQINSLAFSPDSMLLASASEDSTARLWRMPDGASQAILQGHSSGVKTVRFNPEGTQLVTASGDGTARIWDVTSGKMLRILSGHNSGVNAAAFSPRPGEKLLATAGADGTVRLWDLSFQSFERILRGYPANSSVNQIALSPDGSLLASRDEAGVVLIWKNIPSNLNLSQGEPEALNIGILANTQDISPFSLEFSPDGRRLASVYLDKEKQRGGVVLWDIPASLNAGQGISNTILMDPNQYPTGVAFSPSGSLLVVQTVHVDLEDNAFSQGQIHFWEASSLGANERPVDIAVVDTPASISLDLAFSRDEKFLAGTFFLPTSELGGIRLWDVSEVLKNGKTKAIPLSTLSDRSGAIYVGVEFNPNKIELAVSGFDVTQSGFVEKLDISRVLETAVITETFLLRGDQPFYFLDYSPDGKSLAVGSADDTVRLLAMPAGQETPGQDISVNVLRGHEGGVYDVAFSPNGSWLASGGEDGTIRLWALDVADLEQQACKRAGRNLSRAEWDSFLGQEQIYGITCSQYPIHPTVIEAIVDKGLELARQGEIDAGLDMLRIAQAISPTIVTDPQAAVAGQLIDRAGEYASYATTYTETLATLSQAVQLDPTTAKKAASTLLTMIGDLVSEGKIDQALASARQAVKYDPSLELVPEKMIAEKLVEYGRNRAYSGDYEGASASFQKAVQLDPTLALVPEAEITLAKGRALALQGEVAKALDTIRNALKLDPNLGTNPETEVANQLFTLGTNDVFLGNYTRALEIFSLAVRLDPQMANLKADEFAYNYYKICWNGSLDGLSAEVLPACERAVELAPGNPRYREGRGLARALTGDFNGAIEDFQDYLDHEVDLPNAEAGLVKAWIAALKKGKNPFNEETLRKLRLAAK